MIGIFDSGSGGLTVLKAIRGILPSADVVYFGDIKNAPYGEKTRAEISHLTISAIRFLAEHGATRVVSACNSTSASLAVSFLDAFSLPLHHLIEMVGPTVSALKGSRERFLLLATPATIASGIYQEAFGMIDKEIQVIAMPGLAGSIEFGEPDAVIEKMIRDAFVGVRWDEIDGVILGCTHYPLVFAQFRKHIPERVFILDPAQLVAERVEKHWWPQEVGNGELHFYLTQHSKHFRERVDSLFLSIDYSIDVVS